MVDPRTLFRSSEIARKRRLSTTARKIKEQLKQRAKFTERFSSFGLEIENPLEIESV